MKRTATALMLVLAGALVVAPAVALARPAPAPQYSSSDPPPGAMLHEAPAEVTVSFSEPLDPSSTLRVTDSCGRRLDGGSTQVLATDMSTSIVKTPAGRYTVSYSATGIAGVTGSTNGSFSFTVHAGTACDGSEHEGHGGGGGGHDKHENHGSGGHNEHAGSMTSHTDHSDMGAGHTEHEAMGGSHHSKGAGGKESKLTPPKGFVVPDRDNEVARLLAGREEALMAVVLTIAVGLLGGWMLRASALG